VILFNLFDVVFQLSQLLLRESRQLTSVVRSIVLQVPPKVEYALLTDWGRPSVLPSMRC
jgi:DNA-binding HxlR family transcriptional regulator